MRIGLFIFLLFQLCIQNGLSQEADSSYTLFGTVLDSKTHEPLIGANVLLVESDSMRGHCVFGAMTDVEGEYHIEGVPAGWWLLLTSYVGYSNQERWILIQADSGPVEIGENIFLTEWQKFISYDCGGAPRPLIELEPMKNRSKITQEQIENLPIR